MAYPPAVPPATRTNNTPMSDNHPADHTKIANALTDIINELGNNPSGAASSVTARLSAVLPVGSISMYGRITAPSGWLLCEGQAVSRSQYGDLYAIIGTGFGSGNGTSTFNLPDFRGRFPVGRDASDSSFNAFSDRSGWKDAIVVDHDHTMNHNHTNETASGNKSTGYYLQLPGYQSALYVQGQDNSAWGSGNKKRQLDVVNDNNAGWGFITGDSNRRVAIAGGNDHTHPVSIRSYSGTTGDRGSSPTNRNLPPYQTVAFIIRAVAA